MARCRVQFSSFRYLRRPHHCRACGQVFCTACSARTRALPSLGMDREVRVCDTCYDRHKPSPGQSPKPSPQPSPKPSPKLSPKASPEQSPGNSPQQPRAVHKQETTDDEELQLALALSQSEAEARQSVASEAMVSAAGEAMDPPPAYSTLVSVSKLGHNSETNGTNWATAPPTVTLTDETTSNGVETGRRTTDRGNVEDNARSEAGDLDVEELDQFTETLSSQLEMFVTRMQSDCSRGRSIAGDSCVQTMFLRLMALHGRLVRLARAQEEERARYEELQDKVSQVQDARAALDALRSSVTYWCAI